MYVCIMHICEIPVHCGVSLNVRKYTSNHCSLFPSQPPHFCLRIFCMPLYFRCTPALLLFFISTNPKCKLWPYEGQMRTEMKCQTTKNIPTRHCFSESLLTTSGPFLQPPAVKLNKLKLQVHTSSLTCFSL